MDDQAPQSKAAEIAAEANRIQQGAGSGAALSSDERTELEELRALYLPAFSLVAGVMLVRMGQHWGGQVITQALGRASNALVPLDKRYGNDEREIIDIFRETGIEVVVVNEPKVHIPAVEQ